MQLILQSQQKAVLNQMDHPVIKLTFLVELLALTGSGTGASGCKFSWAFVEG